MKEQDRQISYYRVTGWFLIVIMLSAMIMLTGCDKVTKAIEGLGTDTGVEILESGYSIENSSVWAVVKNNSEKTYNDVHLTYYLNDSEGNHLFDGCQWFISIPYMKPGTTHYVADSLNDLDGFEEAEIDLEAGKQLKEDSLSEIRPADQIEGKNLQILYRDGQELECTFDIENDTDYEYQWYVAYYLYKDENGKYCGGYTELIEGLSAHNSRTVECHLTNYNGSDIEIYLRPSTEVEDEEWEHMKE